MLIAPEVLDTIMKLKREVLGESDYRLKIEDALVALSISATSDPVAAQALSKINEFMGLQAHSTVMLSGTDENCFRKLHIDVTADPEFASKSLFIQ